MASRHKAGTPSCRPAWVAGAYGRRAHSVSARLLIHRTPRILHCSQPAEGDEKACWLQIKRRTAEPPGSIATALRNTSVCKVHDIHHLQAVLEAYAAQVSCFMPDVDPALCGTFTLICLLRHQMLPCCAAWLVRSLAAAMASAPHLARHCHKLCPVASHRSRSCMWACPAQANCLGHTLWDHLR